MWSKFISNISNKAQQKTPSTKVLVERESDRIFSKYEKTFKDLARYDRGEKILTN